MSSKSKLTFAVAIVLSAATAAVSAPKHPVTPAHHSHRSAVTRYVSPPATYQSFGSVRRLEPREPEYMRIQDRGLWESQG
jgi:hypothetical protein